jgi:hypothetical protein
VPPVHKTSQPWPRHPMHKTVCEDPSHRGFNGSFPNDPYPDGEMTGKAIFPDPR